MESTMLSTMAPPARSSLEEMLESVRRRDERPKEIPPELPVRPTSKARLPSLVRARRSLPISCNKTSSNSMEHPRDANLKPKNLNAVEATSGDVADYNSKSSIGAKSRSRLKSPDSFAELNVRAVNVEKRLLGLASRKRSNVSLVELPGVESPYVNTMEMENDRENLDESSHALNSAADLAFLSPSPLPVNGSELEPNGGYVLNKDLRVWCNIADDEWELGKIQCTTDEDILVLLLDGRRTNMKKKNILPANPDVLEGIDDVVRLSYLNEPSVLHNLHCRYSQGMTYTKAGPLLVAINPYKRIPLCGTKYASSYRQKHKSTPHVYEITDNTFNELIQEGVNQSIIISGESGAGKTETAKIAMQYLAVLGGGTGIGYKVLETSPILEAFGNAKTSKNDNSSRFGKLIEIHFSTSGKICGAKIQTFLLEKSRVVQRAKGERSFHIFYQLCAGATVVLKEKLNLKAASEYNYLNQSDCLIIDGVDDGQQFHMLLDALNILQISKDDQEKAFAMLAAVLWLGNIAFMVIDNENHVEVVDDECVSTAATLLGCNVKDLILALSTHKIRTGNDNIVQKLSIEQATDVRDAMAKSIYAGLYDWLVEQINRSLEVGKQCTARSISILDICGFESFHKNSLEQLLINYANERLQQHFNRHLLKLGQEEYTQDGIEWRKVDFEDNQECLSLFEKKPLGLLSLLDEESTFPNGTDITFTNKLVQHLNDHSCFKRETGPAFSVCHNAGKVLYDATGFLDKNRDLLHPDSIQLLASCTHYLLQLLASNMTSNSKRSASPSQGKTAMATQNQSVGLKCKAQLFKLMQHLENTTPHFICCIKPNSSQLPGLYEKHLVLQQLRSCNILEVVRVYRSGYPTRMTHQSFARRYGFLLLDQVASQDPLGISIAILRQFHILPDMYQVGYMKLFFRTGQVGALEVTRNHAILGIVGMQKHFRGFVARRHFHDLRRAVIYLQSYIRGEETRKEFGLLIERQRAAIAIQRQIRLFIGWRKYRNMVKAIVLLQSVIRGWNTRRQFPAARGLGKSNLQPVKSASKLDKGHDILKDQEKEPMQLQSSVLAELERRVLNAEAALKEKEDENVLLQERIHQYERRWTEYETRMRSMEEKWQKQMMSLQMSLAAAKKSLAADDIGSQAARLESPSNRYYDSEDATSGGSRTSESNGVQWKPPQLSDIVVRDVANGRNAAAALVKEFEHQRRTFEDDASFIVGVKANRLDSGTNPLDELRKLKMRLVAWKKDYKARLRETKATLQKLGHSDGEKARRKWWGKRTLIGT